jgi:hypothetical protein
MTIKAAALAVFLYSLVIVARAWEPYGFIDSSVRDHYLSYRTQGSLNKTPVIWTEAIVFGPEEFYVDVFDSHSLSSSRSQQNVNEIDLVLGKKFHYGTNFTFDSSVRYMDFEPYEKLGQGDYFNTGLLTTWKDFQFLRNNYLQPALDVEWLAKVNDIAGGGYFIQPGVIHRWVSPLGIKRLVWTNREWFSWDHLKFMGKKSDGFFFRSDTCFSWKLSKHWSAAVPGVRVITPVIQTSDGRKADVQTWAGLRLFF